MCMPLVLESKKIAPPFGGNFALFGMKLQNLQSAEETSAQENCQLAEQERMMEIFNISFSVAFTCGETALNDRKVLTMNQER